MYSVRMSSWALYGYFSLNYRKIENNRNRIAVFPIVQKKKKTRDKYRENAAVLGAPSRQDLLPETAQFEKNNNKNTHACRNSKSRRRV